MLKLVRLVANDAERRRHDERLEQEHYLHNAHAMGQVLRYVAVETFVDPQRFRGTTGGLWSEARKSQVWQVPRIDPAADRGAFS